MQLVKNIRVVTHVATCELHLSFLISLALSIWFFKMFYFYLSSPSVHLFLSFFLSVCLRKYPPTCSQLLSVPYDASAYKASYDKFFPGKLRADVSRKWLHETRRVYGQEMVLFKTDRPSRHQDAAADVYYDEGCKKSMLPVSSASFIFLFFCALQVPVVFPCTSLRLPLGGG